MKPSVYIETSVISYRTGRPSRDLVVAAHQQITEEWWLEVLPQCEPHISPVVLTELEQGDPEAARRRMAVVEDMGVLAVTDGVVELASEYFAGLDLPEAARPDSYHLALAVCHGMDFMVTWNCKHIAGARTRRIVQRINAERGVNTPVLCTPEELMEV